MQTTQRNLERFEVAIATLDPAYKIQHKNTRLWLNFLSALFRWLKCSWTGFELQVMCSWIRWSDLLWKYLRVLHSVLAKCQMLNVVWCGNGKFAPNLSLWKVKGINLFSTQPPRMHLWFPMEVNYSIQLWYIFCLNLLGRAFGLGSK
jgi:hypothetical protein